MEISVYNILKSNGIFINTDQVLGDSKQTERIYRSHWLKKVKASKISKKELNAGFERMKEDKMSTLDSQIMWLKQAGFTTVNCWYKYFNFVVYSGSKA